MDLPQVDSCCCGLLDLKVGTIIVGIVTLCVTGGGAAYQYTGDRDSLLQGIMYLIVVIGMISSVLVIIGAVSNKKQLVQIYVIAYTILLIATIVLFVLFLLGILKSYEGEKSLAILSTTIYVLIVGYCLIVANSFSQSM